MNTNLKTASVLTVAAALITGTLSAWAQHVVQPESGAPRLDHDYTNWEYVQNNEYLQHRYRKIQEILRNMKQDAQQTTQMLDTLYENGLERTVDGRRGFFCKNDLNNADFDGERFNWRRNESPTEEVSREQFDSFCKLYSSFYQFKGAMDPLHKNSENLEEIFYSSGRYSRNKNERLQSAFEIFIEEAEVELGVISGKLRSASGPSHGDFRNYRHKPHRAFLRRMSQYVRTTRSYLNDIKTYMSSQPLQISPNLEIWNPRTNRTDSYHASVVQAPNFYREGNYNISIDMSVRGGPWNYAYITMGGETIGNIDVMRQCYQAYLGEWCTLRESFSFSASRHEMLRGQFMIKVINTYGQLESLELVVGPEGFRHGNGFQLTKRYNRQNDDHGYAELVNGGIKITLDNAKLRGGPFDSNTGIYYGDRCRVDIFQNNDWQCRGSFFGEDGFSLSGGQKVIYLDQSVYGSVENLKRNGIYLKVFQYGRQVGDSERLEITWPQDYTEMEIATIGNSPYHGSLEWNENFRQWEVTFKFKVKEGTYHDSTGVYYGSRGPDNYLFQFGPENVYRRWNRGWSIVEKTIKVRQRNLNLKNFYVYTWDSAYGERQAIPLNMKAFDLKVMPNPNVPFGQKGYHAELNGNRLNVNFELAGGPFSIARVILRSGSDRENSISLDVAQHCSIARYPGRRHGGDDACYNVTGSFQVNHRALRFIQNKGLVFEACQVWNQNDCSYANLNVMERDPDPIFPSATFVTKPYATIGTGDLTVIAKVDVNVSGSQYFQFGNQSGVYVQGHSEPLVRIQQDGRFEESLRLPFGNAIMRVENLKLQVKIFNRNNTRVVAASNEVLFDMPSRGSVQINPSRIKKDSFLTQAGHLKLKIGVSQPRPIGEDTKVYYFNGGQFVRQIGKTRSGSEVYFTNDDGIPAGQFNLNRHNVLVVVNNGMIYGVTTFGANDVEQQPSTGGGNSGGGNNHGGHHGGGNNNGGGDYFAGSATVTLTLNKKGNKVNVFEVATINGSTSKLIYRSTKPNGQPFEKEIVGKNSKNGLEWPYSADATVELWVNGKQVRENSLDIRAVRKN